MAAMNAPERSCRTTSCRPMGEACWWGVAQLALNHTGENVERGSSSDAASMPCPEARGAAETKRATRFEAAVDAADKRLILGTCRRPTPAEERSIRPRV